MNFHLKGIVFLMSSVVLVVCWRGTVIAENVRQNKAHLMAHRGLSEFAPENSKLSFRIAKERGFSAFELDLHATADNEFMVFHDRDLRRFGRRQSLCEVNSTELAQLSLHELFLHEKFHLPQEIIHQLSTMEDPWLKELQSAQPLKLSELLPVFASSEIVLLDLKYLRCSGSQMDALERLGTLLKQHQLESRVYLESQDVDLLREYKRRFPKHKISYWNDQAGSLTKSELEELISFGVEAIDMHWSKYSSDVRARLNGFQVFLYTVNDKQRVTELRPQVDVIMTDLDLAQSSPQDRFEFFNSRSQLVKILSRGSNVSDYLDEGFEHWYRGEYAEVLLLR